MNQFPPQQVQYLPPPKTNGSAIASMVMGIVSWILYIGLWCFNSTIGALMTVATYGIGLLCLLPLSCISPLLWLIGVITGHVGVSQIRRTGEGGQGMAVTGLVLNYLGLLLIVGGTLVLVILLVTGVISLGALGSLIPLFEYYQY